MARDTLGRGIGKEISRAAMVAGDTFQAQARPWTTARGRELWRAVATLGAVFAAWWIAGLSLSLTLWVAVIGYCALQSTLMLISGQARTRPVAPVQLSIAIDAAFAVILVSQARDLGAGIYPLYLLLAIRSLATYHRTPVATIVPFALGPAYLFAYSLSQQIQAPSAVDMGSQWLLLAGSLAFGGAAIWSSASQHLKREGLDNELRVAQGAAEERVAQMQRTAADLRARMRERHALEEGLRAITSTLSLDDVLSQIIDSTIQMLGPHRVRGIVLSLDEDGTFKHRSLMLDEATTSAWASQLARRAMRQQVPLIVGDVAFHADLAETMPPDVRAAMSVPLFVGEGAPRGALSVVSIAPSAFNSSDARHMTAFAIQAGIAIRNAEMHNQIRQQQSLLGAVLRDISDGLVVVDSTGRPLMTNPLGRQILEQETPTLSVRDQVLSLAQSIHSAERSTLMAEIRLGDNDESDDPRAYQAIGSLVRHADGEEPLAAIVLHDITDQKLEEKRRAQFISMVAHELRNPLNSLNGFVKLVLQGRAGSLTPLQEEFLQIADTQVELLKGRISELLEYNRVEAGRLKLAPSWNDLPLLITGTSMRLKLQAEQAGLSLLNEIDDQLPELYFDSERIGQVLTNLIENAIKATPPGGEIRVRSQVNEDEVWIRVCDTGVGIPPEEQRKIFEPFVQGSMGTSRKNHLGLGLAICKQIVDGHRGRLWVESEPGRGTCFTVALPLVGRERSAEA